MRYALRDRDVLQYLMQHPGRGTPYTIRSLAEAIGLSHHSLIGHLVAGTRQDCDGEVAERIARALGVALLVLFAPPASPDQTNPDTGSSPTTRSPNAQHTP